MDGTKQKDNVDFRIIIVAIIALCVIESIALMNGINGVLLGGVIAAIAGLAGWSAPQLKIKSRPPEQC